MKGKLSCLFLAVSMFATAVVLPQQAGLAQGMQPPKGASAQPSKQQAQMMAWRQSMGAGMMAGQAPGAPGVMAVGACSLCYTCGGGWPTYGGTIPTPTGATERGEFCAGDLAPSDDTIPYLCCRQ